MADERSGRAADMNYLEPPAQDSSSVTQMISHYLSTSNHASALAAADTDIAPAELACAVITSARQELNVADTGVRRVKQISAELESDAALPRHARQDPNLRPTEQPFLSYREGASGAFSPEI